jgi:hypothetical protein
MKMAKFESREEYNEWCNDIVINIYYANIVGNTARIAELVNSIGRMMHVIEGGRLYNSLSGIDKMLDSSKTNTVPENGFYANVILKDGDATLTSILLTDAFCWEDVRKIVMQTNAPDNSSNYLVRSVEQRVGSECMQKRFFS